MSPSADTTPAEIAVIAGPVQARLRTVLDDERARWQSVDAQIDAPLDALARLVLGSGKRLRPAFCYWGFVAAGGDRDDPRIVDVGAAFELLHAFALIHDDVMDGSDTRRGDETIHVEFAELHRSEGWRGETRRFGDGVAILVGDLAEVYADRLFSVAPPHAVTIWNELKVEVNIGQYLDVLGTAKGGVDHESSRRISRYKSGKYTIERPLQIGAALVGDVDGVAPALSEYGEPLGEAFQLRDDILGVFGDTTLTGKPVGDDLREGKPTPLLALADKLAGPGDRPLLDRIGASDIDDADIAGLQELLDRIGARASVERSISHLVDAATDAIRRAPITASTRDALVSLAEYVAAREH